MKKVKALLLTAVVALSMSSAVMAQEAPKVESRIPIIIYSENADSQIQSRIPIIIYSEDGGSQIQSRIPIIIY